MKALLSLCLIARLMHAADADEVRIVPLKQHPDLLAEVVDMWWDAQGTLQAKFDAKPTTRMTEAMQKHMNDNQLPLCLIARKNDKLVGMARLVEVWTTDPEVAPKIATHPEWKPWLCGLFVAEAHRRQGIGTSLIQAIEAKAQELGHESLHLGTSEEETVKFYERRGYQSFDEDTFRGEHETLMRHALKQ